MHRSVLSGTIAAVIRGESGSAPVTQAGESRPRKRLSEDQAVDRAQSLKANFGTPLVRLTAALLAALLIFAGRPGLSAPPGSYRPPLSTIGNPNPIFSARFGESLAGVGNDRILIGVPGDNLFEGAGGAVGGSAYLFNTNGALLMTFANPGRRLGDRFGNAVTTLGTGRILVGSHRAMTNVGAVCIFNLNGTLLNTLTNPPLTRDSFGTAVAAVGTDRVLVGAPGESSVAVGSGAAYLLTTNGTLLTTFQNPDPIFIGNFGSALSGVGKDHVVIGANNNDPNTQFSGRAYLFTTGGDLVTTYTNPAPVAGGRLGESVAGMGSDRVLIGAVGNKAGGFNGGMAYLFDLGGNVLATFTNPVPRNTAGFGHGLAVVGGDRALIGAFFNDTGTGLGTTGAAYLFDTNGTLLATYSNPTPAPRDRYGYAIAALGQNLFVVGADGDYVGADGDSAGVEAAGSVYVYAVPRQPPLSISANASSVSVRWAGHEPSFILQEAGLLGSPAAWNDVQEPVTSNGPTNLFQQPLGPTNRFYRLRWP